MWTALKVLDVISALAGAGGTVFLYKGTFGFVALTPYTNNQIVRDVADRNKQRLLMQRVGLSLLLVSFLCSLVHAFIE